MGKTINHMYTAEYKTSEVALKIQGPKSLIGRSEPIIVDVKVNSTWAALLNDQLKLKLPVDQGIYICNPIKKWRMDLNQQVLHYVNQYRHNMDTYTACIRHPDIATFRKYRHRENVSWCIGNSGRKLQREPPTPPISLLNFLEVESILIDYRYDR